MDALAYDPHKFAMDYHNIGFRECAAEVARYLVTVEGMDIQDPLRLRLMSHLQCFAAQRELATKQAAASSWSYGSTPAPQHYPPSPGPASQMMPHQEINPPAVNTYDVSCGQTSSGATSTTQTQSTLTPLTTASSSYPHHQYHMNLSSYPSSTSHHQNAFNSTSGSSQMKPYRPWGAEVAY